MGAATEAEEATEAAATEAEAQDRGPEAAQGPGAVQVEVVEGQEQEALAQGLRQGRGAEGAQGPGVG